MTECANPRFEVLVNHKGISVKSVSASVRENMFLRFVFISFCFHFHCCESFQVSKFTISRIAFAIKRFQSKKVSGFLSWENGLWWSRLQARQRRIVSECVHVSSYSDLWCFNLLWRYYESFILPSMLKVWSVVQSSTYWIMDWWHCEMCLRTTCCLWCKLFPSSRLCSLLLL